MDLRDLYSYWAQQVALAEFLHLQDIVRLATVSLPWEVGERVWALILFRDYRLRAPDGVPSNQYYKCIRQWRSNAELSMYDLVQRTDADDTLAYMVRNMYCMFSSDDDSCSVQDPSHRPHIKREEHVLWAACSHGFVDTLRALMNKGVSMTTTIQGRASQPLHVACRAGQLRVVQFLTSEVEGLDVNAWSLTGETPLHLACYLGHTEIVKYMVMNVDGVDVCARSRNGETPFLTACQHGKLDVVRYLADEVGVDVNESDVYRKTPLYQACFRGHLHVVRFLLQVEGIDVNAADENNSTPYSVACMVAAANPGKHGDIVALLAGVNGLTETTMFAREVEEAKVGEEVRVEAADKPFNGSTIQRVRGYRRWVGHYLKVVDRMWHFVVPFAHAS